MGQLLTLHFFLGMLLIGPVSLKIGSTLWRFTRYYTGSASYVRKGPPAPLQRVTGPLVILTTAAVLGTGVMLAIEGPGPSGFSWIQWHHKSFLLWAAVMVIHLASYVPRLPWMLSGRVEDARHVLAARPTRWMLLCASLGVGLGLAFAHLSPLGQLGRLGQPHPVIRWAGRFVWTPSGGTMDTGCLRWFWPDAGRGAFARSRVRSFVRRSPCGSR